MNPNWVPVLWIGLGSLTAGFVSGLDPVLAGNDPACMFWSFVLWPAVWVIALLFGIGWLGHQAGRLAARLSR